jgi:hypothetical protein
VLLPAAASLADVGVTDILEQQVLVLALQLLRSVAVAEVQIVSFRSVWKHFQAYTSIH